MSNKAHAAIEARQKAIQELEADLPRASVRTVRQIQGQIASIQEQIAYIERSPDTAQKSRSSGILRRNANTALSVESGISGGRRGKLLYAPKRKNSTMC